MPLPDFRDQFRPDFAEELRRARLLFQGRVPIGIDGPALAIPDPERPIWPGTTVPAMGWDFRLLDSGLFVPTSSRGPAPIDTMATYITAPILLDQSIPLAEVVALIRALSPQDALGCCGWLMARMFRPGAGGPDVQQELVDALCVGATKGRATALVRDRWVFMAPQVVLGVAKLALLFDHPTETSPDIDAMTNVVLGALGLAEHLGSTRDQEEPMWGSLPQPLSLDVVANQHFNASANSSAVVARHHMLWRELPAARDRAAADFHEEAFLAATGTTMDTCTRIGLALYMLAQSERTGQLSAGLLPSLNLNDEETAAVRLYVADLSDMQNHVRKDIARNGFSWAANSFRRFPIVRHNDGSMTILSLAYLRDRACGSANYFELNQHLNGTAAWGGFKDLRGRVPEDYVGTSLKAMYPEWRGSVKRIWTEQELKMLWPDQRICDFVVDAGDVWICIEVVSHMLSEPAACAQSVEALEQDIRFIAEEKAEQLHLTALSLLDPGAPQLLNRDAVPARVLPVVVATGGFPVNPITMSVIYERLRLLGFLQGAQFGPLEILNLDTLEAIEALSEQGRATLSALLIDKASAGLRLAGMDLFIVFERHLDLPCPSRLTRPLQEATVEIVRWVEGRRSPSVAEVEP